MVPAKCGRGELAEYPMSRRPHVNSHQVPAYLSPIVQRELRFRPLIRTAGELDSPDGTECSSSVYVQEALRTPKVEPSHVGTMRIGDDIDSLESALSS